jgi:hypothetical protein
MITPSRLLLENEWNAEMSSRLGVVVLCMIQKCRHIILIAATKSKIFCWLHIFPVSQVVTFLFLYSFYELYFVLVLNLDEIFAAAYWATINIFSSMRCRIWLYDLMHLLKHLIDIFWSLLIVVLYESNLCSSLNHRYMYDISMFSDIFC